MADRKTTRPAHTPTRLGMEQLEARDVPALFLWTGNGANSNWTTTLNWSDGSGGAVTAAPGELDDVSINGTNGPNSNKDIAANNTPFVKSLTVAATYTGTVKLTTLVANFPALLVKGNATIHGGKFANSSPDNTVGGPILTLQGPTHLIDGGEFNDVTLNLDAGGSPVSATKIDGTINTLNGTLIQVGPYGELNWQDGSIQMSGSSIVKNNGTMFINSAYTLGDTAATPNYGVDRLNNTANLTVYSKPTIAGGFLNSSSFVVRSAADIKFKGKAEQTAGTTELRGTSLLDSGTITLLNTGELYHIKGGAIVGTGTVAGFLTLGTAPNGTENVAISPGLGTGADKIGKLLVTQQLKMLSSNTQTTIDATDAGAIDSIVVVGQATLAGTLTINMPLETDPGPLQGTPKYRPARGTKLTFLTAASFVNNFTTIVPADWKNWMNPRFGVDDWTVKTSATSYYLEVIGSGPA